MVKYAGHGAAQSGWFAGGIEQFLRRNPNTCFVAEEDGGLIGAILCGHDRRRGYIYHTVVHEKYRRRGIGSALVESAVKTLKTESITRVYLNVMEGNEAGKGFWLNRGWEKKDFIGFYSKGITEKENTPLFKITRFNSIETGRLRSLQAS